MGSGNAQEGTIRLLGITLFSQAVTSLVGGLLFEHLESSGGIESTMRNIAGNVVTVNVSVLLQMVTAVIIIILGVAMYRAASGINKTMAVVALSLYALEAVLLAVSQVFVIGVLRVSQMYLAHGDAGLVNLADTLLICRSFAAKIAMIPFGFGAMPFYYLMLKARVFPRWLALWGILATPLILVGVPLTAFGVRVPIALLAPYVPFEFFAGLYVLGRVRGTAFRPV